MKKLTFSALGVCLLGGCTSGPSTPDGAVILDEEVALQREANIDSVQREIEVDGDSVIVAFADEKLTNVRLKLTALETTPASIEVENNLRGSGIEIAAINAPRGSRVLVTLTSPQDSNAPGRVLLRVRRFDAGSKDPRLTAQLTAFKAWSAATNASHRTDAVKKSALADLDRAIASLELPLGDAALAAEARLVKANALHFFQIDWRESRAEAQRAAKAFAALPDPAVKTARARFVEAVALSEIARDRASVNPTSEEATQEARRTLAELGGATSPFGLIERARALDAIGYMDVNESLLADADRRFTEAQDLFHAAGYAAGEFEMRANLAQVLAERGQRYEAAKAYELVLANLDKISSPNKRVIVLVAAAGAEAFSGLTDQAAEHLHQGIAEAREFELRSQESEALQTLAYLYWFRGDYLQAKAFASEALRIARAEPDAMGAVFALQSTGLMARLDGDYATAIDMHKEAIARSSHVVVRMRTMRQLALDYIAVGKYAEATAQLRGSLAVDLQDPRHYAYSDVKRDLAEMLIAHGDGSRASLEEAAALSAFALQRTIEVTDTSGEIAAHRVMAMLRAKQGRRADALAEYRRAFALIFEYRSLTANPQFRMATLEHEQAAFRGYFDLVMRNVSARGSAAPQRASAAEEDALRTVELARQSHFGAARTGQMDAAAVARIDALLARMADKSLEIAKLIKRELTPPESAQLEALQLDMSSLRMEVDRERTAAAKKQAGDKKLPGEATSTWRTIAPGVVQLSYALGDEHAYVWARSAAGTRVAMLRDDPATIERELAELASLNPQLSPEKVEASLEHISSVLLPPRLLDDDSNAVEIVAEGRIASVPFAGLRSPMDASRRLVETHAITLVTSLFAVEAPPRPKQARPFRLVALASGSGTLRSAPVADPMPKLQAATAEIRAISNLFESRDRSARIKLIAGPEGSASALRGIWSSGADVVHFATHALADLRQPLASLLVLPATDGSGRSTYLTAGQVQDWRGDADLVFLSACDSAIGPPRFAGGMPGLQSAFLRAGARGVIATLWPIEDVLAREFSADFYQRFTNGETAVRALSDTQRAWLAPKPGASEAEQMRRRITALAHGFYTQ
jgi:CHAT domain-containing protein